MTYNVSSGLLHPTVLYYTIIQQYGDLYTGRWRVGCYIWYIEEGPGRAAASPSPSLAVQNVTLTHQRSVYQLHIIRCGAVITFAQASRPDGRY